MSSAYKPPSKSENWITPPDLFGPLHRQYGFTIDLAASKENAQVDRYFTKEQDAIKQVWAGERAWCNPPYDARSLYRFTCKARQTWIIDGARGCGVFLVPAKTDQDWWHEFVWDCRIPGHRVGVSVNFIKGRVNFLREGGGPATTSSPEPSVLITFFGKWVGR